jgi:hypothetical protein
MAAASGAQRANVMSSPELRPRESGAPQNSAVIFCGHVGAQRAWKNTDARQSGDRRMKTLRLLAAILCVIAVARGTTVIPPTFDELVRDAELIVRGRVTALRSGWSGTAAGSKPRIATWVTITVERVLRGEAGATLTLEFIGGEVGERRLDVAGWPRFAAGERGIFFVENRQARMCPLVRLRHGRYRIIGDGPAASAGRVVRDDYSPVEPATDVAVPLAERSEPVRAAAAGSAMSLADFEARIAARAAALPAAPRQSR